MPWLRSGIENESICSTGLALMMRMWNGHARTRRNIFISRRLPQSGRRKRRWITFGWSCRGGLGNVAAAGDIPFAPPVVQFHYGNCFADSSIPPHHLHPDSRILLRANPHLSRSGGAQNPPVLWPSQSVRSPAERPL